MVGRGKSAGGNNCCACEADEIGADVAVGAAVVGVGVGVVVGAVVAALTAAVGVTGMAVAVDVAIPVVADDCGTAGKVWVGFSADALFGMGVRLSTRIPTVSCAGTVCVMAGVGVAVCLISGRAQADKLAIIMMPKKQKKKWMFLFTMSSWLNLYGDNGI